jgi:hypothetical protein
MLANAIVPTSSALVVLVGVIGGGTIVPLAYSIWQKHKPEEKRRADATENERVTRAAREAVEAVRGVLTELRAETVARDTLIREQSQMLIKKQHEIEALQRGHHESNH